MDLGLKRVEMALHSLELRERMGREEKAGELGFGERNSRARQRMGHKKEAGAEGWYKPKKKKNRKKNKYQTGLLGPKPSKAPVKVKQPTSVQQPHQAGESSEMGAARVAGMTGTKPMLPDSVDQRHESSRVIESAFLALVREEEMDGEHDGGVGLGEELSTLLLSSIPESADLLDYEISTPVKSSKQLSTILESIDILGDEILTPVESSKRLSGPSENTGDLGLVGPMPVK